MESTHNSVHRITSLNLTLESHHKIETLTEERTGSERIQESMDPIYTEDTKPTENDPLWSRLRPPVSLRVITPGLVRHRGRTVKYTRGYSLTWGEKVRVHYKHQELSVPSLSHRIIWCSLLQSTTPKVRREWVVERPLKNLSILKSRLFLGFLKILEKKEWVGNLSLVSIQTGDGSSVFVPRWMYFWRTRGNSTLTHLQFYNIPSPTPVHISFLSSRSETVKELTIRTRPVNKEGVN